MPCRDLREFIDKLEDEDELLRVKCEVDWKYEMAGWVRRSYDMKPRGPALLFEKIRGYGSEHSFFTAGLATRRRFALALGLPPSTSLGQIITEYYERCKKPIAPKIVKNGPCKENIHIGDEVDLLKFPAPYWHPRDGGRFIGTWSAIVSKDPETGVRNVGMYRLMIHNKASTGISLFPFSGIGHHFLKSERKNEPLPIAVAIGTDPTVPIVACAPFPVSVDEYTMAGALRKSPLELVKCETVDLEVPSTAEIVLEGEIAAKERKPEGPFGEFYGYHGSMPRLRPVFHCKCVTHRDHPIFRGIYIGKPIDEEHIVEEINCSALGLQWAEGKRGVRFVAFPSIGVLSLAIIQMDPQYAGHPRDVGHAFFGSELARWAKMTVLVDEDVDPFDLGQVWWAVVTRTQGSRDYEVLRFCRGSRADPSTLPDAPEVTDKLLIDATKKLDYPYRPVWRSTWAPVAYPPKEIMELVELKWRSYAMKGATISKETEERIKGLQRMIQELEKGWERDRSSLRSRIENLTTDQKEKEKHRAFSAWTG